MMKNKNNNDSQENLLVSRFIIIIIVFLLLVIPLSYLLLYIPLKSELEKETLDKFEQLAKSKTITLEYFIERSIESAESISSRSYIRDKIIDYESGNINFEELKELTYDRYLDGLNALDNIIYAARIIDDNILLEIKELDIFYDYEFSNEIEIVYFEEENILIVFSPIKYQDEYLGSDVIGIDFSSILSELIEDNISIELIKIDIGRDTNEVYIQNNEIVYNALIDLEDYRLIISSAEDVIFRNINIFTRTYFAIFISLIIFLLFIVYIFIMSYAKKIFLKLKESKETAIKANKSKNLFMSKITHDLKTPLNSISGFAELIKMDVSNEENKEYLDFILYSSKNMFHLINDLLDISKIENNSLDLNKEVFSLRQEIKNLLNSINIIFNQNNNELIVKIEDNVPDEILGDHYRLNRIIQNLLSNSNKFTKNGEIELNIFLENETISDYKIGFIVSDTGKGIKKEKLDNLFTPYYQAHDFDGNGTGLGLALCKELVELMNGNISIESVIDKGTKVTFNACFKKTLD